MERTLIGDLAQHIGKEVSIEGWVDVARNQGKMAFFDFRDRSGIVQGVALPKSEALDIAQSLKQEWVVRIEGKVNERPEKMRRDVPNGNIELEITKIEVLSEAHVLPFEKDTEVNLDTYLDHLPLTLRSQKHAAVFKLQATLIETYREALRKRGFTEFQAPALVGGDAEGGAGVFSVPYFYDKTAYLATSPQFYKQIMVGAIERAFTTTRAFRAEKHATTRHLNEYISLDMEMGFIKDHKDVMAVLEGVMRDMVSAIAEKHADTLTTFKVELPMIPEKIPAMKLREAQELIFKETGEDCRDEPDLEPAHERFLCEYAKAKLSSDFVFITHYPVSKRPFYTYEDEEDPGFTKSFDLLYRGVEIVTGGQRVHSYDELVKKMERKGLNPALFSFYLQTFKYGMPPHGGCAIGLERLTQKFLELENVKEATLFPRDINRIDTLLSE